MKKFKIGLAVVGLLVGVSLVAAFSSPVPQTKFIASLVATAQTVDGTPTDIGFFNVFDNAVMHAQARIVAIELLTGEAKSWQIQTAFKRVNGVLSLIGNRVETEFESGDPTTGQWDATITLNDTTNQLCIEIEGAAGEVIEWMAHFQIDVYQP